MNVGLRLIELRKQRGLTTNKLANLSGLSQSFIRSVELNEKGITVENLQLLCDTLQLSLHNFLKNQMPQPIPWNANCRPVFPA